MRWSLMTYTVNANQPGGLPGLAEIARFAREVEFAALELSARDLNDHTPEQARAICAEEGLAISCINGPADLATADEAGFEAGIGAAMELAEAAVTMACPVLMLIPGRATSPEDKPRAAARIAEGLGEVVSRTADLPLTVTIEDFPNPLAPYASIAEVRYLFEAVPGLGLTFDNGNWVVGGDDPVQAVQELAGRIANCHLKDWEPDPDRRHIQLPDGSWIRGGLHGQGLLDQRAILGALITAGYDGALAFEYEGPMDHCEATRRGMAYLRGVLAELQA